MSRLILPINDVAAKVAAAGFTGWQVVTGTAVVTAESGRNAYAVNVVGEQFRADGSPNLAYRSLDVGLFQVNTFWHPSHFVEDLLDPDENCRIAYRIFTDRFNQVSGTYAERVRAGWSLWVTYQQGFHRPFEGEAAVAAHEIGAI